MSALDEIRKIRKQKEEAEKKKKTNSNGTTSSFSSGIDYVKKQRENISTTGKLDLTETYNMSPLKKTNTSTLSPVKTSTKDKDEKPWYKSFFKGSEAFKDVASAFDDGYDRGDIAKTILKGTVATGKTIAASTADLGLNLIEGVGRVGEGVGTLLAGGTAQVLDWAGNDEKAEQIRNRIAGKEETAFGTKGAPLSAWLNQAQKKVDKNSIFGSTGDEVASLVGYTGGLAVGGGAIGGATKTATIGTATTGASANLGNIGITLAGKTLNIPTLAVVGGASSGLTEAYGKEDVTDAQAWGKALGSGAIEGITEGLFGVLGVGGSSLDDAIAKGITNKFKSGLAKGLAKTGVSATGEAVEEFLSYAGNQGLDALIDKASSEGSADFYEKWDWAEVGEQMAMGFISGGIAQGGSAVIQVQAQTKLAITEAEKQLGRPLTSTERNSIKKQVTNAIVNETPVENEVPVNEQQIDEPQEYQTIEEIDNQIEILESQLSENLSDKEYDEITNKIKELENQAEQIQEIESISEEVGNEINPTTTQQVETNSLVDASSNTLENVNESVQGRPVSPVNSGQVSGQVSEQQTTEKIKKGDLFEYEKNGVKATFVIDEIEGNKVKATFSNNNLGEKDGNNIAGKEMEFDIDSDFFNNSTKVKTTEKSESISPLVMTEEEYLGSKGYSFMGYAEAGLHNSSQHVSKRGKKEAVNYVRDKAVEYDKKREELRQEYQEKVANGEIRKPTIVEQSLQTAQGMDDNPAVQAARRTLAKRGIDWKTGEKISQVEQSESISPIKSETTSKVQEDLTPIKEAVKEVKQAQKELKETMDEFKALTKEQAQGLQKQFDEANSQEQTPPPEVETFNDKMDTMALDDKTVNKITKDFARGMKLNKTQKAELNSAIKELSSRGNITTDDVLGVLYNYDEMSIRERNNDIAEVKGHLKNISSLKINQTIANDVDMPKLRQLAKNNLKFKVDDVGNVDIYYEELSDMYPHLFPTDVNTPSQQFEIMVDIASTPIYSYETMKVPHGTLEAEAEYMYDLMQDFKIDQKTKDADKDYKEWVKTLRKTEAPQEIVEETKPSPVKEEISKEAFTKKIEELSGEIKNELGYIPKDPRKAETYEYDEEIAKVLTEEPKTPKEKKNKTIAIIKANLIDRGMVFEDLSLKTKNRKLQAKWDYTLTSESRAQYIIGNGHTNSKGQQTSKSLNDIMEEVNNTGKTKVFYNYMYHNLNVDRMSLAERFEGMENKAVFGDSVTAEYSKKMVQAIEKKYPKFKDFAKDVYDYVNADRAELVRKGVISPETAKLWQQMYPHYVPIRRADHNGNAINVALDTNRTGINAPIKKATGGNSDILPLFDTMAQRTIQTMRATAKNSFGIELKNTLKAKGIKNSTNVDEVIDSIDNQDGLLQKGENGSNPTFTVFEKGERVTYEITEEMYEALKPLSDKMNFTFKPTHIASNIHRGLLTQYNPFFALKNGVKDIQDVLINSQHPLKTYAKVPEAYAQLLGKGHWYNEYMRNGGEQNSYFDSQEMNFDTEHKGISKVLDLPPLKQIAQLNDFIERVPRLAEYIASREAGKGIEESMLDAARVTTNFKAGGNFTKLLNRNGATFLNASVQGALQQVRNVREAKMNGARGWANLATKFAIAGIPAMILNSLLWGDDEEYEELSDYVKQGYYIVGKYGDGQFYRIPKGRTVAVIQDAMQQISNVATGDDEADLKSFLDLVVTNLAPSDPLENNIFSPIKQVLTNKSWYGEELVPQRLQDLPAEEQFDETTDTFSRWLGEKTGIIPIKINYLLNQYSGVVGDVVMPMITPKATQGEGTPLLAPLKDIFTVDGVMKNQNVSDFYSTSEELTKGAKSKNATDEDVLKNKYINSVKTELNDLYKEKREIQSDLSMSKGDKYKKAKEIQKQINEITKDALSKYSEGNYTDNYGIIDDREYYKDEKGDWQAVDKDERVALNEMGLSLSEKSEYVTIKQDLDNIKDEYVGKGDDYSNEKEKRIIDTITSTNLSEEAQVKLYKRYYNSDKIDKVMNANISASTYFDYVQQEFKADYNAKGNAISGSRKNKVIAYVNEYDLDIPQKAILIKMTNTFKFNDYNYQIVDYVGGLDISYEEKIKMLEDLDMKVYDDGTVEWE